MKTIKEEIEYIKKRNTLFNSLMSYAEADNFIKVESDLFENLFSFMRMNHRFNMNELIKLEDKKGDIYILRPDITTNIIKQVIPRIHKGDEFKLYYLDNIYGIDQRGEMTTTRQFGVEMIGGNSYEKEVELLSFIEGLLDRYQLSYVIEIGNQLFIDILITQITDDEDLRLKIKDALMKKSKDLLNRLVNANNPYAELLLLTINPMNTVDMLESFIQTNQLDKRLLNELNRTLNISKRMNQEKIIIDLSLISPYDYYNGPIFKGYIDGYSRDVFRGGRYDTLTQNYGTLTKALGFSLDLDLLMKEVL